MAKKAKPPAIVLTDGKQDRNSIFEPQIHEWQTRPLDEIYPVVFIDATHYSVRENGIVKKLAAYVILAINLDGHKNRRKRECKILARRFKFAEKSRLEGYFDFVCRRFSSN